MIFLSILSQLAKVNKFETYPPTVPYIDNELKIALVIPIQCHRGDIISIICGTSTEFDRTHFCADESGM